MASPDAKSIPARQRILAVLPIGCGKRWGYWYRDLGLVVRTLREQGHDAWLVLLPSSEGPPEKDEPVIIASREELESPAWWKAQAPEGVILNLWGALRWERIRESAREATPRLLEKLDTAGIYSPAIWWWGYFYVGYWGLREAGSFPPVAALKSLIRTCALWLGPGLLDKKRAQCLARMPVLAAESPLAVERTKRYLRAFAERGTEVVCVPHPVDDRSLAGVMGVPKENKVISVGRWQTYQKNFPLLMETLGKFLGIHPGWSAEIFGQLPADAEARLTALPAEIASRILLAGTRPNEELARHYAAARIFLMSSRHESFNIAAAEALCSGCSVVGPPDIASVHFFTGRRSGSASSCYSPGALLDALCAEAEAWRAGERDARAISSEWTALVGAQAVTARLLELVMSGGQKTLE
ncbi:MAG TPA: glycosyltransferase [Chthoniobacteraceae bacterium]|nr:glycosyltransferase [Chthoniobacteraceae bacterium]